MNCIPRRLKLWREKELFTKVISRNSKTAPLFFQKIITTNKPTLLPTIHHTYSNKTFMGSSGADGDGGDEESSCVSQNDEYKFSGRHQFHQDTEDILNVQTLAEFQAAFEYLSIGLYFGRTEIALPGCQGFFMNMYEEELGHANLFSNFLLMRGGRVNLTDIKMPEKKKWTVTEAFSRALQMEKGIKETLITVFDVAEKHKDLQIMDLVSTDFMEEQNRSICEMARLVTRSKITDTKVGEYLFDQMIFKSFVKKEKDNLMYNRKLEVVEAEDKRGIYK